MPPDRDFTPVGEDPAFAKFWELYRAAGKKWNEKLKRSARAAWSGIPIDQRDAALECWRQLCTERDTPFLPNALGFILDEHWTMVAEPRTLPAPIDPRQARRDAFWAAL